MNQGLFHFTSPYDLAGTVGRLEAALESEGFRLFARFDHAASAAKAGLFLPPTQLLVFGNPKAGTPLMLAAPTLAIDLPSRILVRENEAGRCEVYFSTLAAAAQRHRLVGQERQVAAFDQKVIALIRSVLAEEDAPPHPPP